MRRTCATDGGSGLVFRGDRGDRGDAGNAAIPLGEFHQGRRAAGRPRFTSAWMATASGGDGERARVYEKGKWKVYRPQDGLAHRAVLGVAVDRRTAVVWAATMGGLTASRRVASTISAAQQRAFRTTWVRRRVEATTCG